MPGTARLHARGTQAARCCTTAPSLMSIVDGLAWQNHAGWVDGPFADVAPPAPMLVPATPFPMCAATVLMECWHSLNFAPRATLSPGSVRYLLGMAATTPCVRCL
jgi:hypothetical protein